MAAYLIGGIDMITCKEDLIGTYVDGRNVELGNAYQKLLFKFGVKWLDFNDQEVRVAGDSTFTDHFCFDGDKLSWNSRHFSKCNYKKELTERDLKPKPTKFVKVEESIFDLKGEFERGELYSSDCEGHYTQLKCEKKLYLAAHQDSVYRRVEMDWRDELDSYLDSISNLDSNFDEKVTLEFSKSKFSYNMSDSEFVAVCHLVASLTDKPE